MIRVDLRNGDLLVKYLLGSRKHDNNIYIWLLLHGYMGICAITWWEGVGVMAPSKVNVVPQLFLKDQTF